MVGVVGGAALGRLGLRLTRFEQTPLGLFYTPNAHLGVALSLLFLGRLIYRVFQLSPSFSTPAWSLDLARIPSRFCCSPLSPDTTCRIQSACCSGMVTRHNARRSPQGCKFVTELKSIVPGLAVPAPSGEATALARPTRRCHGSGIALDGEPARAGHKEGNEGYASLSRKVPSAPEAPTIRDEAPRAGRRQRPSLPVGNMRTLPQQSKSLRRKDESTNRQTRRHPRPKPRDRSDRD